MQIFPAIDLSGGQVVRLYQGDYDKMTVYGVDPCAVAREFMANGAKYLHVVDLDGAKDGTLATSRYGNVDVTGVVKSGRVYGTQFHPEKSGDTGLRLLKAFAEL